MTYFSVYPIAQRPKCSKKTFHMQILYSSRSKRLDLQLGNCKHICCVIIDARMDSLLPGLFTGLRLNLLQRKKIHVGPTVHPTPTPLTSSIWLDRKQSFSVRMAQCYCVQVNEQYSGLVHLCDEYASLSSHHVMMYLIWQDTMWASVTIIMGVWTLKITG